MIYSKDDITRMLAEFKALLALWEKHGVSETRAILGLKAIIRKIEDTHENRKGY